MWLAVVALVCLAGHWFDARCPWGREGRRERTRRRTKWERTNKAL